MDFKRLLLISTGIAAALLSSCKKDEEDEVLASLSTNFKISLPAYAKPGEKIVIYTKDILKMAATKDGGEVGYYWKFTPERDFNDTIKYTSSSSFECDMIEVVYPDTLCEAVFTLTAFAKEHYSSSASVTTTIVDAGRPSASLTFNGESQTSNFPEKEDSQFTDPRDGKVYITRTIGSKEWFKQNLAWEGSGHPYMGCNVMSNVFGRYYTWDEARTACPEGWRLTTEQDWVDMAGKVKEGEFTAFSTLKGIAGRIQSKAWFNKKALWEYWPVVDLKESSYLNIANTGYATYGELDNSFTGLGTYAAYWLDNETDSDSAYIRYIFEEVNDVLVGTKDKKSFGATVRCVRDI